MIQQMITRLEGIPRLAGNLKDEAIEGFRLRGLQRELDPNEVGLFGNRETYQTPDLSISNKIGYAASQPVVQLATGVGTGMIALNLFGGNSQQQQAPQQSMTQPNQPPAGMSQAIPQVIGMESVTPLNEEQVKKAQKRAMEQAALNAFYAQQLGQYNGGQE